MTILYKPVLIESAEQAAALDGKAILVFALTSTGEVISSALREDVIIRPTFPDYPGETVTALVPIEATAVTRQAELCKPGTITRYIADVQEEA